MKVLKAIRANNLKKLEKLLKGGFDVNTEIHETIGGRQVYTIPICLATARGSVPIVEMLLKYGADIHKSNSYWSSPLHMATFRGYTELITLLLVHGVRVNRRDIYGDTALNIAIREDYPRVVKILINAGADINIKNNDGENALSLITCVNNTSISQQIKEIVTHIKESKLQVVNDLKAEISEVMAESTTIQENIYKLEEKLRLNESILVLKREQEKKLENEIEELERTEAKIKDEDLENNNKGDGLECPICFSIPLPPTKVYQCKNGHIHCGECREKLDVCPMCRVWLDIEPIRNRAFEEIVASVFRAEKR